MKRFIDLRGQHTGCAFAFWDTVRDIFETHGGEMAWNSITEFREAFSGPHEELKRYLSLIPEWVDL